MPTVDFGRMDDDATLQDLIEAFAKVQKMLDYLMQGGLDSKNAKEFGGWLVGLTELQSRNKTVGMSTDNTGTDPIRFWAGDLKGGVPNFKVTEAGIMTAVAGAFLSALGYPRVTINESADSLLKASLDATHSVYITPDFVGGTPALVWAAPVGGMIMFIKPDGSGDFLINASSGKLDLTSSTNDVEIKCATGYHISVNSWNELYNRLNGQSLQTALNAKQNTISGYSGSFTAGTKTVTVSNGIITSVV